MRYGIKVELICDIGNFSILSIRKGEYLNEEILFVRIFEVKFTF